MSYFSRLLTAVTFDLWNTLFENVDYGGFRERVLQGVLCKYGVSLIGDELTRAYLAAIEYNKRAWKEENFRAVPTIESINYMISRLELVLEIKDRDFLVKRFQEAVFDSPPALKEGVVEALEFLSTDYCLGIISDTGITPGCLIRPLLEDHDIIDYFDAILFSDEVGVCKPHLDIFISAQKALGSRPNSSLHIGDMVQTDIIGAKNAGWRAVWVKTEEYYTRGGSVPKFMELWLQTEPGAAVEEIQPDYTINSLCELMKLPLFKS